jgi:uncharacterized membrane protein
MFETVIGILFPPSIIVGAAVGGAIGAVTGHFWRGMCRADVEEFGDVIDPGQAALIVVGGSAPKDALDKADLKAKKRVAKELDVSREDIDKAVQAAAKEMG